MPLSRVIIYFPPGLCLKFAPPPSFAAIFAYVGVVGTVIVMVGVSVAGSVTEIVTGTGLGVSPVSVAVMVPSGAAELVGVRGAEVFAGRIVFVVVGIRIGVKVGSADGCVTGVDVATTVAASFFGKPDPVTKSRIPTKSRKMITLKMIPPAEGRSLKAYKVISPRMLASAKCARKTNIPCGQTPSRPYPRPMPLALMGR